MIFNASVRLLTFCILDLFPMYVKPVLYMDLLLIDILQGQLGQPPAPRDGPGEVQAEGRVRVDFVAMRF